VVLNFSADGVYRVSTSSIDRMLDTSSLEVGHRQTAVVSVGGATGVPPIATARVSPLSGPVPLNVTVDMTGSYDPDGTIQNYLIDCGTGFGTASTSPTATCSFTTPGMYWLLLEVQDNTGQMDLLSAYVVATPPDGPADTTPPSVSVTQPTENSVVTGQITLAADSTDTGGSGMKNVVFHLVDAAKTTDSILGTVTSTTTPPTYSMLWNPAGTPNGSYTIYAVATDNANNSQASAPVDITLNLASPPPAWTISIDVNPLPVRKGTSTITATPSDPSVTITRVEFYINDSLVGTANGPTGPYTFTWKVPAATKTYRVFARAYDSAGKFTDSKPTLSFTP